MFACSPLGALSITPLGIESERERERERERAGDRGIERGREGMCE